LVDTSVIAIDRDTCSTQDLDHGIVRFAVSLAVITTSPICDHDRGKDELNGDWMNNH
jgi:hypothetical protein